MADSFPSCPYRRGSPLLIGVRSKYKLSTEQVPVLYRPGECLPSAGPPGAAPTQARVWPQVQKLLSN